MRQITMWAALSAAVVAMVAVPMLSGCAQNTESGLANAPTQATTTPVRTDQETGTQGTVINNNFYFGTSPGDLIPGSAGGTLPYRNTATQPAGELADASTALSNNSGWSFQGNRLEFTMTTGGTTPTVTADASGTGTGTQEANPNQSVVPTQSPETSLSANAGLAMPGSAQSQQATAAGSGGTVSGTEQTATQTPTYTQLTATVSKLAEAVELLKVALGIGTAAPPTTMPAE